MRKGESAQRARESGGPRGNAALRKCAKARESAGKREKARASLRRQGEHRRITGWREERRGRGWGRRGEAGRCALVRPPSARMGKGGAREWRASRALFPRERGGAKREGEEGGAVCPRRTPSARMGKGGAEGSRALACPLSARLAFARPHSTRMGRHGQGGREGPGGVACLACPLSARTGRRSGEREAAALCTLPREWGRKGPGGRVPSHAPLSGWRGQVGRGGAGTMCPRVPAFRTNGVPRTGKGGAVACPRAPPFRANVVARTGEKGGPGRPRGIVCPISACEGGGGGQREGRMDEGGEEAGKEAEATRACHVSASAIGCAKSVPYLSSLLLLTPVTLPSPPPFPFASKD
ncbi:hypothetical protein EDB84DRAFT_1439705 [Lactarius hengduanensis]|nr:hypothetical protein EDB84DRAFT_1439705 [Lactarius hengduanensis]